MVVAFWSLNYEVQFYAVIGIFLLLARFSARVNVNALILSLTGISLLWLVWLGNIHYGLFVEYWPVFALGCLVFMRLCKFESRYARLGVDGFLVLLAVICLLARFRPTPIWIFGQTTEALMIGACFSLLLILLRGASESFCKTRVGRFISFLGLISYSLYLIHQFNLNLARTAIGHLMPHWTPTLIVEGGVVAFHVMLATIFWHFCERPFLNESVSLASFFKPAKGKDC